MARYTVDEAKTMFRDDPKGMRAEYTRMRDIAQKRIKRMAESEWTWTKIYKEHAQGFQKISEIDPRDFAKAFSELSKFVGAKSSSIRGQEAIRKKTTETLNEAIGEKKVNKRNYKRVIEILNESRKRKVTYDSDKVTTLAETTLSLTDDQFDDILDNLESLMPNASDFSETFSGTLSEYMKSRNIENYQVVDIDDFLESIGWK